MKNVLFFVLLFAFIFASPDKETEHLSYKERKHLLNLHINKCVLNSKVSDKVKTLIQAEEEDKDLRFTLRPIVKELQESDLELIRSCRKEGLDKYVHH